MDCVTNQQKVEGRRKAWALNLTENTEMVATWLVNAAVPNTANTTHF
jgi:hypothetical protein